MTSQPQNHLGNFWTWFPVALAAVGGVQVAALFGWASYTAVEESRWYAAFYASVSVLAFAAPPAAVWRIVRWVNRELGKAAVDG